VAPHEDHYRIAVIAIGHPTEAVDIASADSLETDRRVGAPEASDVWCRGPSGRPVCELFIYEFERRGAKGPLQFVRESNLELSAHLRGMLAWPTEAIDAMDH
jgi:hypothetical protein